MDGRVEAVRAALDAAFSRRPDHGLSAEIRLRFYGPFRDAIGSSGALKGDKRTYRIGPASGDEAFRGVRPPWTKAAW